MDRIELILKERQNRKIRSDLSWVSHIEKIERADKLLENIEKKIKSKKCISEARKQYITSCITAFEVYFKDRFLELLKIFGNERIIEQIKIKFDVPEVEKILKERISINEIIASYFNFQELDQINKAFSILLEVNFFEEIKNKEFKASPDGEPFKIFNNTYNELKALINLRHDFVHDINFKKNITKTELMKYTNIYNYFILAVDVYTLDKSIEHSKKNHNFQNNFKSN